MGVNRTIDHNTIYIISIPHTRGGEPVGGMAANELNTFNGQLDRFKNELGDAMELIGNIVLPTLTSFLNSITDLIRIFNVATDDLTTFDEKLKSLSDNYENATKAAGDFYNLVADNTANTKEKLKAFDDELLRLAIESGKYYDDVKKVADAAGVSIPGLRAAMNDWTKDVIFGTKKLEKSTYAYFNLADKIQLRSEEHTSELQSH